MPCGDCTPDPEQMLRLLQQAIDAWPQFETDEPVSSADLVDWFHLAPGAAHWQGHNDRGKKYLGVSVIFNPKRLGDRVDDLIEWRDSGRRTDAPKAHRGADAHDWNDLSDLDDPPRDFIDIQSFMWLIGNLEA